MQYKFLITTFGSLEELGLESSAKITEITPPSIHDLSPSHYREPRSLSLSLGCRFLIRSRSIPRRDNAWIDAACYRSAVKHVPWRCGQGEHGHKREELEVSPRMERRDGRSTTDGGRTLTVCPAGWRRGIVYRYCRDLERGERLADNGLGSLDF